MLGEKDSIKICTLLLTFQFTLAYPGCLCPGYRLLLEGQRHNLRRCLKIASYTAIVDAGESIIQVLRDNMTPEPIPSPDMIGLCSPAETGDLRLGLYLYSIKENREYRSPEGGPVLALTLYYLLTAYSNADIKQRAYDESYILGGALQVLRENSYIDNAYLQGSLAQANEAIHVQQHFLSPEEMQNIWIFPEVPYRTSVGFMVYPVIIDTDGFIPGPRTR